MTRSRALTFVAVLLAVCGSYRSFDTAHAEPALADGRALSLIQKPEDVVRARRAAYFLSGGLMDSFRNAAKSGQDIKDQEFAASALAGWARTIPLMFPDGSDVPPTHANPNVWTDRAGFVAKAKAYEEAATKLAAFAATDDRLGFARQISDVHDACDSCHKVYHQHETPSDGKR